MKLAPTVVVLLVLGCSDRASAPAVVAAGGSNPTTRPDGSGSSESGAGDGASVGDTAGDSEIPSDNYDDSGCDHPKVVKSCEDGWCTIPPGCFIMGSPEREWGHAPQEQRAKVTLSRTFVIGEHEVTNGDWAALGLENPGTVIDSGNSAGIGDCSEANCPVGNVTWFEAVSYANLLSDEQGLSHCYELIDCVNDIGSKPIGLTCQDFKITAKTVYDCEGYRLPTGAEWEYAARAGTRTAFYSGDIESHGESGQCVEEPALNGIAWYCHNAGKLTKSVGQLEPNGWGLFDMLGNAAEWANDESGWVPSAEALSDPDQTFGPGQSRDRRGGPQYAWPSLCRAASRLGLTAGFASPGTGFRLVRTLPH